MIDHLDVPGWIAAVAQLVLAAIAITTLIRTRTRTATRPPTTSIVRAFTFTKADRFIWPLVMLGGLVNPALLFFDASASDREFAAFAAVSAVLVGVCAVMTLFAWGRGDD